MTPVTSQVTSTPPVSQVLEVVTSSSQSSGLAAQQPLSSEEVALLRRLLARLDVDDSRESSTPPGSRPAPDPPYGMPPGWKNPNWAPGGPSSTSPMSMVQPPSSAPLQTTSPAWGVLGSFPLPSSTVPPSFPPSWSQPQAFQVPDFGAWGRGSQQSSHELGFQSTHAYPSSVPFQSGGPQPSYGGFQQSGPRPGLSHSVPDPSRLIKMEPPTFDGSDAQSWVTRISYFFDHIMLAEEQRIHYAVMLFVPPASDWVFAYRASNPTASWGQFLEDVRRRFDQNYFVNHIELIAKLSQTGALLDYNREFERIQTQIRGVPESTLLPIYMSGLRNPVRSLVRFQHPTSVAAAMALALEFDSSADRTAPVFKRPWPSKEMRPTGPVPSESKAAQPSSATPQRSRDYSKLPVVRLTAAERAEKTRLGLCWYCSEKWAKGHVCKGKFLAYMGSDDEEDEPQPEEFNSQ